MSPRRPKGPRALVALGALAASAAVWGIGVERHLYTVRRATLAVLPPGATPLRVLHLSDVHMAPWQSRKQAWIAHLASLRPDLIVNTGDNLGHPDALRGIRAAFAGFRGIPGVYVHGSNDLFAPQPRNPMRYFLGPSRRRIEVDELDTDTMDRFFTETLGWSGLNNASARLEVAGVRIDAFGVDDAHHDLDRLDLVPQLASGLAAPGREPSAPAALTIGVTHAPYRRVLDAFTDAGADAIFAGHTHGGQVRVPGLGALVANCDLPLDQVRGLSTWQRGGRRVPLHVSAGLGHSIYAPVRFACPPETTLLTLLPRTDVV
ncbi:metallophosphoesterase family protein [Microbacterium limosum]|uniref:Metallophosphoesterase family protein n=1 Tax=Microbacterium limosum TaxID=3079935 RepID=A0AAU0MJA9_9MICO|nr:metallophosphoesterase [Microbacterium sp. Y20]WOQ70241.1 metallophosphoesterase family protein [Microbacterium sp. Y20]